MAKTLEDQIKALKQEAEDRDIFWKASLVARELGKKDYDASYRQSNRDRETIVHVFNDSASLIIRHSDTEYTDPEAWDDSSINISYNGKEVFAGSCYGVRAYIPGEWEAKLEAFHGKAQQHLGKRQAEIAQKTAAQKRTEEKIARAQWGLEETPHDIAAERQRDLKRAAQKAKLA